MFDQQIQRWVGMTPDLGMDVEVTDPDDEIMLSRVYYDVLVYICTGSLSRFNIQVGCFGEVGV